MTHRAHVLDGFVRLLVVAGLLLSQAGIAYAGTAYAQTPTPTSSPTPEPTATPTAAPPSDVTLTSTPEPTATPPATPDPSPSSGEAPSATLEASPSATPEASPTPTETAVSPTPTLEAEDVVTVTLDAAGGVVTSPDVRARLEFPPGALSGPAAIVASALRPERDGRGHVRMARFRLNAYALDDQGRIVEPLTRFARPYTLTVDVRGVQDLPALQPNERLALYYAPENAPDEWIEIARTQQPQPGVLVASLDHFTAFAAGATASPSSGWKLVYHPPVPDLFSGAATYNYPIDVPPGRNGLQPRVNLAYSSRGLDGLLDILAIDSGPIGMGWSLNFMDIIREDTQVRCCDNAMIFPNRFSLLIDGSAYELQPATANATYGRYYVKDAPGIFVERHNDQWISGSPSNASHEYWIVRLPDGTLARLGYTTNSEQTTTGFVLCDAYCGQTPVSRWRVDVMTDTLGNAMAFTYIEQAINQRAFTSEQSRPTQIQYNSIAGGYGSRVEFTHSADPGGQAIDRIKVFHAGVQIREYRLSQSWIWNVEGTENGGCGQSTGTYVLNSIQVFNGAGTAALPATTFSHTLLGHWGYWLNPNPPCARYAYIGRVDNGYGGATEFSYGHDVRRAGCYPTTGCEGIGYSYRVSEIRTYDGLNASPARTQLAYGTRCYHQSSASDTNGGVLCRGAGFVPYWGPLVGHDVVTQTVLDFNGVTVLSRDVHRYYITDNNSPLRGREHLTQNYDPNTLLTQSANAYTTAANGPAMFTYASAVTQTTYTSSASRSSVVTYTYDAATGNRLAQFDYGDTAVTGDERSTYWDFYPNPSSNVWIVNKLAQESVYEGLSFHLPGLPPRWLEARTRYWYDNRQCFNQAPTQGALTAVGSGWSTNDACDMTPFVITRTGYDQWGNPTVVTDTRGYTTTTTYESTYRLYPITVKNAKGHVTQYQYYGINVAANGNPVGLLKSVTDPNSATTTYTYDTFGRLLTVVRPSDSDAMPTTQYAYIDPYLSPSIQNSGFEGGSTGWVFFWSPTPASVTTGTAYAGQASLQLQGSSNGGAYQDVAGLTPGKTYIVSAWVKATAGATARFNLWLHDTAEGNTVIGSALTPSTSWSQVSLSYTANATGRVRIHLYYTAGSGTIYVDDVHMVGSLFKVESWQRETSGCSGCVRPILEFYDGLGRLVQTRAETVNGGQQAVTNLVYEARGQVQHEYAPAFESFVWNFVRPGGWNTRPRTSYQYDALGRTRVITAPDGTITKHNYGLDNDTNVGIPTNELTGQWVHSTVDANSHAKHYVSDAYGRLVIVRDFTGTCYPGSAGCTAQTQWTKYAATRYAYDVLGHLTRVTDTLGNTTVITYNVLGQKTGMTDPDMGTWKYQYDAAGNLITQTNALNQVLWFKYDPLSRLVEKRQTGGSGTLLASYTYDTGTNGKGQRTVMTDPSGSTTWTYDARGRMLTESKTLTGVSGTFVTAFGYDAMDRVITTTYPGGEVITQTYNAAAQLAQVRSATYSLNYASGMQYNALGQVTQMTYGNGELLRWGYRGTGGQWDSPPAAGLTSFGRLFRLRAQTGAGVPLFDLRYGYDAVGNVTAIREAPRAASGWPTSGFTFQDPFDTKNTSNWTWSTYQAVVPEGSNNVIKSSGTNANWNANFYRNAYSLTSGKGLQLRFKVDATDTQAHFSIEANDATYRRFGVIADAGKLSVQYNDGGGYRYPADLLTSLQVNTWYVLRIVVDDGGRGFYVEAYQESAPSVRGSFVQWMPTGKSWRFHHWIWRGNAYLDDYREFSTSGLTWSPHERLTFAYDHLDRLTSAAPESGGQGYSQAFQYNAIGNITSFAGTAYAYNDAAHKHAVTHLGGVQKYWYDANGSMTTRIENGVTYQQAWDVENRLTSVSGNGTTTFTYDGDGARVKKVNASGTTVYVGAAEVLINATQRITRTYYAAGTQLVAMRVVTSTGGNTLYYLHTDHLGSASLTTNSSGGEVARQKYYPYGQIRPGGTGSMPTDVGFTGQRLDATGLMFYQARYFSPVIGRFVSADTIVPETGNLQSLNRYSYVNNNPVKYTDPTGHWVCDEDTLDCSTRRWHRFGASANLTAGQMRAIYGIRLTADEGHPWTASDISNISEAVQQAAAALDFATWANGRPTNTNVARFFKSVLYSNLTFHRSAQISAGAASTDNGTITVYARNATTDWRLSPHNAVHELGHAISQSAGRQPYNDLNAAQITDNVGNVIAGGGGPGPYVRTDDGYATAGFLWQQHRQVMGDPEDPPTANEDFADMFLGWAYGNFANDLNGAGAARNTWMSANMPGWIALAVNGN